MERHDVEPDLTVLYRGRRVMLPREPQSLESSSTSASASASASASDSDSTGRDPEDVPGAELIGVVDPHWCRHCTNASFAIHLYDRIGDNGLPVWDQPNPSLLRLISKYHDNDSWPLDLPWLTGVSVFDVSVNELVGFWQDGCVFAQFLLRSLFSLGIDDVPQKQFVFGASVSRNIVEFMVWDVATGRRLPIDFDSLDDRSQWLMLAAPESSAAEFLELHGINDNAGSLDSLGSARIALEYCHDHHPGCQKPEAGYVPLRLIRLWKEDNALGCQLQQMQVPTEAPYATLSYCWGSSDHFRTTSSNLEEHTRLITFHDLPLTLQHAIIVTHDLGLQYIWIDAICIIQDSDTDKSLQIGQMAKIYENSTVIITASRASSVHDGFLGLRSNVGSQRGSQQAFVLPCRLSVSLQGATPSYLTVVKSERTFEDPEPVDFRGWTLQERILSPRKLDFRELRTVFECRTLDDPLGRVTSDGWSRSPVDSAYRTLTFGQLHSTVITRNVYHKNQYPDFTRFWLNFVYVFSRRSLKYEYDRLPAIAGIAETIARTKHDTYYAGHWRSTLAASLLWRGLTKAEEGYTAPSWSWASANGEVDFPLLNFSYLDRIHFEVGLVSCETKPLSTHAPYGVVAGGSLVVRGHVRYARFFEGRLQDCDTADWNRDYLRNMLRHRASLASLARTRSEKEAIRGQASFDDEDSDYLVQSDDLDTLAMNQPIDVAFLYFGCLHPKPEDNAAFSPKLGMYGLILTRAATPHKWVRIGIFEDAWDKEMITKCVPWFQEAIQDTFSII